MPRKPKGIVITSYEEAAEVLGDASFVDLSERAGLKSAGRVGLYPDVQRGGAPPDAYLLTISVDDLSGAQQIQTCVRFMPEANRTGGYITSRQRFEYVIRNFTNLDVVQIDPHAHNLDDRNGLRFTSGQVLPMREVRDSAGVYFTADGALAVIEANIQRLGIDRILPGELDWQDACYEADDWDDDLLPKDPYAQPHDDYLEAKRQRYRQLKRREMLLTYWDVIDEPWARKVASGPRQREAREGWRATCDDLRSQWSVFDMDWNSIRGHYNEADLVDEDLRKEIQSGYMAQRERDEARRRLGLVELTA